MLRSGGRFVRLLQGGFLFHQNLLVGFSLAGFFLGNFLLGLGLCALGVLQFGSEFIDPALHVHESHLTGKEWMTVVADVDANRFFHRAGNKRIAAAAGHDGVMVPIWVDSRFHKRRDYNMGYLKDQFCMFLVKYRPYEQI